MAAKHMERGPNGKWRVARYIPQRLQSALGVKVIRKTLGTTDESVALTLKDRALAEIQARIDQAEAQLGLDPSAARSADFLATMLAQERAKVADLEAQLARAKAGLDWGTREIERVNRHHPALTAPQTTPTFREAAERFIESRVASSLKTGKPWRTPAKAAKKWRDELRRHTDTIADKPVDQIGTPEIMGILAKHPPAQLRPRLESVLQYARAVGWRQGDNPASVANLAIPITKPDVEHYEAMAWRDVPKFFETLSTKQTIASDAMRFVILTACRKSEGGGARWDEIDLDTATWTIPRERTKTGRVDHVVPLSHAAMAILQGRRAAERPRDGGFVFPGRHGTGQGHSTLGVLLERLEAGCTVHGFRTSFRMWAADNDKVDQAVEFSLSHVEKGVRAAYQRSTLLEQQRQLMQEWADYVLSVDAT